MTQPVSQAHIDAEVSLQCHAADPEPLCDPDDRGAAQRAGALCTGLIALQRAPARTVRSPRASREGKSCIARYDSFMSPKDGRPPVSVQTGERRPLLPGSVG